MKHRLVYGLIIAVTIVLTASNRHPVSASDTEFKTQATLNPQPESCPTLGITINSVVLTPAAPAQQHVVNLSWSAGAPQCFSISGYQVKGFVTFANGQAKEFEGAFPANQTGAHIPVPGITNTKPQKVVVKVGATATDAITGTGIFPSGLTVSQLCHLTVKNVQASMTGLAPAPNRPGQDFHPKVRVQWQVDLASCQRIDQFKVEGELIFKGKSNKFSQTVAGNLNSIETTLTSLAVGSDFAPDSIRATVTATGQSTITGSAQKEIQVR